MNTTSSKERALQIKVGKVKNNAKVKEGTLSVLIPKTVILKTGQRLQKYKTYIVQCDPTKEYEIGSNISITPFRKISKTKSWIVISLIKIINNL